MNTVKIKTSDLSGKALDWAAADAIGKHPEIRGKAIVCDNGYLVGKFPIPSFHKSWSECGILIDKFDIWLSSEGDDHVASIQGGHIQTGISKLIAACRAIVAAELGDEVEIPEELVS